jgi:hypothetical protein
VRLEGSQDVTDWIWGGVLVLALAFGGFYGWVLFPRIQARHLEKVQSRCERLGFLRLELPEKSAETARTLVCAGERRGFRVLLTPVGKRTFLPPRLEIILEARLEHSLIRSGSLTLFPGGKPLIQGPEKEETAVAALLTPDLQEAVQAKLAGRFVLNAAESYAPQAPLRALVKSRWPEDLKGLLLRTWVELEAAPERESDGVEAGVESLLALRSLLMLDSGIQPLHLLRK